MTNQRNHENLLRETLLLRPAIAADDDFLFALYASSRAAELAAWGWPLAQQQAFLLMQYRTREQAFATYENRESMILCEVLGENMGEREVPIGRWLLARSAAALQLVDVTLLPEQQKRGIGTWLLRKLQATAQTEKKPVRLQVAYDNPARRLYERCGFVMLADHGAHLLMEWQPNR